MDITGCRQVEEALVESEKKYRALFETMSEGIVYEDHEGKIISANPAAERLLGLSLDQMQGRTSLDPRWKAIHEDGSPFPGETHSLHIAAKTGKPAFDEIMGIYNPKSGTSIWLSVNSTPEFLPGGKLPFRAYAVFRDITERKQAEEKMLAEFAFRSSIELSLRSGIAIVDDEGRQSYVNPFFCELVGWTEEDLLGKIAPFVYWPSDQLQAIDEAFRQTMAGNAPQEGFELEFVRKNGVRFPTQIIISPFTNGNQRTGWLANVIDITERKQVEIALKESENHSRSIIEAIPDLMFVLDSEGVYLDFKADVADLAYQKESITGKKNRDMMPPDFADLIDEKIKRTLQTGSMQLFEYQLELPQKGIYFFEARMVQCGPESVLAIVRNITERKISEAKILEINKQLTELNATKDKFFNIIAHDLKSPFNSIVGFSELLVNMARDKDYDEMGKFAGFIHQSSHRAIDLLMNLMEWARSQTGRIEYNPEILEIDELINDVVALLSNNAAQKRIKISKTLPSRGIAKADKAMISTVLRNLVANAIKFTKPGGEILISVSENNSGLTVAVKDNGIGIPAHLIGKLFRLDESFTTRGTEKEQGTGLGLILCREFIEKHHGTVCVESTEGKGSMFSFTLPE
jgi:PAS domain S-box-containing protein